MNSIGLMKEIILRGSAALHLSRLVAKEETM